MTAARGDLVAKHLEGKVQNALSPGEPFANVDAIAPCIAYSRDSDMQQNALGHLLDLSATDNLRRRDLLFWRGHVAIARDADTIVHAHAFHMATVIEHAQDAIARIRNIGSDLVAIRRLA